MNRWKTGNSIPFTYPLKFNTHRIINRWSFPCPFVLKSVTTPFSSTVFSLTWHISLPLLFLSQLFIYGIMLKTFASIPLPLVLFSNLNHILFVLNEKYWWFQYFIFLSPRSKLCRSDLLFCILFFMHPGTKWILMLGQEELAHWKALRLLSILGFGGFQPSTLQTVKLVCCPW